MSKDGAPRYRNIAGQRFEHLTALYPLEKRSAKRNVVWHCRCDCGNEADFSYNALMYSHLKSCGCRKQAHHRALAGHLARVDGTSLDRFKSSKANSNTTTGVKGVYLIRGKYVAKMVFQKKQYALGTYDTLEEAAQARRAAEESVVRNVLVQYAKWKKQADADPAWAQENPVQIRVDRDAAGRLRLVFRPDME